MVRELMVMADDGCPHDPEEAKAYYSAIARECDRDHGPRYAEELDQAAVILQRVHPIGRVKAIGRLEVVAALRELFPIPSEHEMVVRANRLVADAMLKFWHEQAAWSQATFGADSVKGPIGALKHLEKEAREAYTESDQAKQHEEIADCLFLVFDAARRSGMTFGDLVDTAFAKLDKNKARTWPAPRLDDEPVEHVRTVDLQSVPAVTCPHCSALVRDFDGLGVVHCPSCHHCSHPALSGGPDGLMVCELCGQAVHRHTEGVAHG